MKCPKCNSEECISEQENDTIIYLCIGCGYKTMSTFNIKNLQFQPVLIKLSEETKKMIWKDTETGLYWFPVELEIPKVGILYAQGTVDNISWVYMPMIELTEDEKRKHLGKKEIPDEANKKIFTKENFKEALKLLKVIE